MTAKKYIIFDAGPLINFAMNGLLPLLEKIKNDFNGEFLITKEVKQEVIDTPMNIKRFELEALQMKRLFDKRIIKHADITEKQVNELRDKREEIMRLANSTFSFNRENIKILDKGECAALALSTITKEPNVIVVDERTTRILCENPENLRKLLEKKFHSKIEANRKNYEFFKRFKIIRSAELVYIANKKGLYDIKDPKILEALLYGVKFRGCSISESEINEMKRL